MGARPSAEVLPLSITPPVLQSRGGGLGGSTDGLSAVGRVRPTTDPSDPRPAVAGSKVRVAGVELHLRSKLKF